MHACIQFDRPMATAPAEHKISGCHLNPRKDVQVRGPTESIPTSVSACNFSAIFLAPDAPSAEQGSQVVFRFFMQGTHRNVRDTQLCLEASPGRPRRQLSPVHLPSPSVGRWSVHQSIHPPIQPNTTRHNTTQHNTTQLGCIGLHWVVLGCIGLCRVVLGCIGLHWVALGCIGLCHNPEPCPKYTLLRTGRGSSGNCGDGVNFVS